MYVRNCGIPITALRPGINTQLDWVMMNLRFLSFLLGSSEMWKSQDGIYRFWVNTHHLKKCQSFRILPCYLILLVIAFTIHFRLSPAEFSKICQSVIEKFTDALGLFVWKDVKAKDTLKDLQNNLQIYGERRVNGSLMVKIFVICIITVSDLFEKGMLQLHVLCHYQE